MELRDYQEKIVNDLKYLPGSLLYMSTGTGKTLTSLEITKYHSTSNLLVICPNNAIEQWKQNIKDHLDRYNIVEFKKSWTSTKMEEHIKQLPRTNNYAIVINYEMVFRIPFLLSFVNKEWTIIADEIHRIKNYGNRSHPVRSTRFILKLGDRTPYKIGLSATPTQGNFGAYIDYYTQLRFSGYTDLSYEDFFEKHVMYEKRSYGTSPFPAKIIVGYKYTEDIEETLRLVARRYKPKYGDFEPQHIKVVVERAKSYPRLVREKAYVREEPVVKILITNSTRGRIAKKTLTTGRIYGRDMENYLYKYTDNTIKIDWLKDFLTDTDEVVTVFYSYNVERDSLVELAESLGKKYIVVDGSTKDKYNLIKKGGYDLVIGQYRAMSEAIDGLHEHCHIEVLFALPESSTLYTQAIGRIDRIGQKNVPIYYLLVMEKTIDEAIMTNIENKIEYSELTLDQLEV